MEIVGVHDIAEKFREWRTQAAVEEDSKEEIPAGVQISGGGRVDSGAGMRLGLLGPEQIVLVPELPRAEPRREDDVPLPQGDKLCRLLGFLPLGLLRFRLLGLRGHGGGGGGRGGKLGGAADAEE